MPKWGLTVDQRKSRPWGIHEDLLAPAKTLTDPIHGDIFLTEIEQQLLDTRPLERLRGVRQLGTSHLVYPGATHSRLAHALGTLRAAQDLLDAVVDNLNGPRQPDQHLFAQWRHRGLAVEQPAEDVVPVADRPAETTLLDLRLAEATVLARLGALLHDLCHVPLGHTIEDDLKHLEPHDSNAPRFMRLWAQLREDAPDAVAAIEQSPQLRRELRALILSKEDAKKPEAKRFKSQFPFVTDIVGNTICADLIDYLQRDHYFCGLPLALGNRFVNDFYVMHEDHVRYPRKMVVQITRDGHQRADVVSELVKYLRYRYELSERVLYHHAKVAADAMVGKLLEMRFDALWTAEAKGIYPDLVTEELAEDADALVTAVTAQDAARAKAIRASVREHLEDDFLTHSDDGLLEHLATEAKQQPQDRRQRGIHQLADGVLHRRLFKVIGRAEDEADQAEAGTIFASNGDPARRRQLEESAAHFAGISPRWHVILWIPSPDMRMKVADVLVERAGRIAPLSKMPGTKDESMAIVAKHQRLWGVTVYTHPDVLGHPWRAQAALAWLRDEMDLGLVERSGRPVPSVADLIADSLAAELRLPGEVRDNLRSWAESSGKGSDDTFAHRVRRTFEHGVSTGDVPRRQKFPPTLLR